MHLVVRGAAGFGGKYLQTTDTEYRKDGNGKHDNSQTAYPLCHTAPEQQSVRKRFYIIQHGGSRTCKTGHGFKESIRDVRDISADVERQHTEKRKSHPGKADQDVTVAAGKLFLTAFSGDSHEQAHSCCDTCRFPEIEEGFVIIVVRYCRTCQQHDCLQQ